MSIRAKMRYCAVTRKSLIFPAVVGKALLQQRAEKRNAARLSTAHRMAHSAGRNEDVQKFSNDWLRNIEPEPGKRMQEWRDEGKGHAPGLIYRATDKGARTWSIRYVNSAGERRRATIGPFPAIGLAEARKRADIIKGEIAGKIDVVGIANEQKVAAAKRRLSTLSVLAEAYFDAAKLGLHRGSDAKPKRASTMAEEHRVYDKHVKPQFGHTAVAEMDRDDIESFVARMSRRAPSMGRAVRNIIRQLLSYAARKRLVDHNPAIGVAAAKAKPRERMLSDAELCTLWSVLEKPGAFQDVKLSTEMSLALRMALVTLQRGNEVVGMRWSEIDRDAKTWVIPSERMKGKRQHLVPLSPLALELLELAGQDIGGKEFVFQSPRSQLSMDRRAFTRAMARIVKAVGIPGKRVRTIFAELARRTSLASGLAFLRFCC